jgi:hypothetical protein
MAKGEVLFFKVRPRAAEARLRAFLAVGDIERWIAAQRPWEAVSGGWTVAGELQGWRFRVEAVPGGVRVSAFMGKGEPAMWVVPAAGAAR